jgi:hypothetical protein
MIDINALDSTASTIENELRAACVARATKMARSMVAGVYRDCKERHIESACSQELMELEKAIGRSLTKQMVAQALKPEIEAARQVIEKGLRAPQART